MMEGELRKDETPSCGFNHARFPAQKRPATPPSWQYTETATTSCDSEFQSQFFAKLPGEIRTQIYREAFGDRAIHIDLYACASDCWTENEASFDTTEARTRKQWPSTVRFHEPYWRGNVCNRPRLGHWESNIHTDIAGAHFIIDRSLPSKRTAIGVMGWLMSCRQAYFEAVRILYSNTFYFRGNDPLQDFINQVPQSNLACIEGLILNPVGLKSNIDHEIGDRKVSRSDVGELEMTASILGSGVFHNLRELEVNIIDFSRDNFAFARHADNQVQRAFKIFDELIPKMSSRFGRLQIYFEDFLYETAMKTAGISEQDRPKKERRTGVPLVRGEQKFWRQAPTSSCKPLGYWIVEDNWRSYSLSLVARSSPGSVSQGLRRLIKF